MLDYRNGLFVSCMLLLNRLKFTQLGQLSKTEFEQQLL